MIRNLCLGTMALGLAAASVPAFAGDTLDPLITKYAAAHKLPESLVRRVIKRESGGNPRLVYHGNYGLMQIRLGTARSMGYGGTADGLLDPDTNMSYAVKYLAGAYRVANGDADRAVHYYQTGYYYAERDRSGGEGLRHRTEDRHAHAEASEPHLPGLLARLVNALSHRAEPPASHQRAPKLRRVRVQDRNVASSSSSLYGGRRDVY